jgi:hypothetical protein
LPGAYKKLMLAAAAMAVIDSGRRIGERCVVALRRLTSLWVSAALLLAAAPVLAQPVSPAVSPQAPSAAASPVAESAAPPPAPARRPRLRPSVAWSVIAGLATALVPMAIGGSLLPYDDENLKHVGLYIMQAGFTLTPLVSHAVAGEWARGAVFAIPGVVAEVGMAAVLAVKPEVATYGEPASRVPFASFLGLSLLGAGAGIIDSFLAGERWDRHHLALMPTASADRLGLSLSGSF